MEFFFEVLQSLDSASCSNHSSVLTVLHITFHFNLPASIAISKQTNFCEARLVQLGDLLGHLEQVEVLDGEDDDDGPRPRHPHHQPLVRAQLARHLPARGRQVRRQLRRQVHQALIASLHLSSDIGFGSKLLLLHILIHYSPWT